MAEYAQVWVVNKGGNVVCMPLRHWDDAFVLGPDGNPKSLEDGFWRKPGWRLAASWEIENWIAQFGGANPPSAEQPAKFKHELVGIEARLESEGKKFTPMPRQSFPSPEDAAKKEAAAKAELRADLKAELKAEILAEMKAEKSPTSTPGSTPPPGDGGPTDTAKKK